MAPVAKAGVRTVESDPQFMLLYYIVKYGSDVNSDVWDKVSTSMGLSSGSAASQRLGRLMKAQGAADGATPGDNSPVKASVTPRKRGAGGAKKQKVADVDQDGDADEEPTPKKTKVGKSQAKKSQAVKAKQEEIEESKVNSVEEDEEASTIKDEDAEEMVEGEADEKS